MKLVCVRMYVCMYVWIVHMPFISKIMCNNIFFCPPRIPALLHVMWAAATLLGRKHLTMFYNNLKDYLYWIYAHVLHDGEES